MVTRSFDELSARLVFVIASSFRNIKPLTWDTIGDGKFKLSVNAGDSSELVVIGYRGSALVKLDGSPYFELDGYHKSIPLPSGSHTVEAEFTPYAAFGELVGINAGKPYLVTRDYSALRFWAYASSALELARIINDDAVKVELLKALTEAFKKVPFTSVSREQLILAAELYGMPWSERINQTITQDLDNVFTESSGGNFDEALGVLRGLLSALLPRFGKGGLLVGVGHAHIDAAWLWPFEESRRKVVRTFATVVTLMRRFNFTFIQSSAQYYQWLLEDAPELFNEVRRLVEEGRWILGAGWVEADANMLSGESWARQMLHSQRFYMKHFGRKAQVLWLPDTFGFNQTLPQIAKQSEISLFATHKVFWNDTNRFPYNVFNWVGPDGGKIPAVAFGNGRGGYNSDFTVASVLEQWRNWVDKDYPMLYSYGYGDGGGGPTVEMLLRAEAVNELPILPKVDLMSGISKYIDIKPINEWRGELYLETHRGTLTSHSRVKFLNRRCEIALREAEVWSALAGTYDNARLSGLWRILLRDQFHDVLPGSAIRDVYNAVYPELENIVKEAYSIARDAAVRIAGQGDSLLAFNSLPWDRVDYVTVNEPIQGGQRVDDGYLVRVKVPSVGYTTVKHLEPSEPVRLIEDSEGFTLENSRLRVRLSRLGELVSLIDKASGRELIREPSNIIVAYENAPGWSDAWDIERGFEETSFTIKADSASVKHNGPLLASVVFNYGFRRSSITQEVRLYADSSRLDFVTTMRLVDRELMYKAWFHLDLNTDEAWFDAPYTPIRRPTVTNTSWDLARFEVPMHKWVSLSECCLGAALLNDGKYGVSVKGSSIGLTLARTPVFPDPATDLGEFTFTYSLMPHDGDLIKVNRAAWELNTPILLTRGRPGEASLIRLKPSNLMLEAIKVSEDDEGTLIIRISELANTRGVGELQLPFKPTQAYETNLIETTRSSEGIEINENTVKFKYGNRQVKTIAIKH
ncbi:alpha-mannosidase [Caldivirga sp.]|uniref:alpha-mannosidase n=2 Tax=Caldivirga sp. TaxID=2080243 RepID=UPI003D13EB38